MGEIVNLNRARKRRARAQQAALAGENRVRSGRTGAAKLNDQREQARRRALLDGVRRDDPAPDAPEQEPQR